MNGHEDARRLSEASGMFEYRGESVANGLA